MASGSAATGISGAVLHGGPRAVSFVSGRGFSTGADGGPAGDSGSPPPGRAGSSARKRARALAPCAGRCGTAIAAGLLPQSTPGHRSRTITGLRLTELVDLEPPEQRLAQGKRGGALEPSVRHHRHAGAADGGYAGRSCCGLAHSSTAANCCALISRSSLAGDERTLYDGRPLQSRAGLAGSGSARSRLCCARDKIQVSSCHL
jgi:hypothetical protein